jgi:hypothetical protein
MLSVNDRKNMLKGKRFLPFVIPKKSQDALSVIPKKRSD